MSDAPKVVGVLGLGNDLVEVDRFRGVLARRGEGFRDRVFRPAEQAYAERAADSAQRYAARFAAKEAVMKALGVGIGSMELRDIEVVKAESGAPSLRLHGGAAELAQERGVTAWKITITHTQTMASAVVIALG